MQEQVRAQVGQALAGEALSLPSPAQKSAPAAVAKRRGSHGVLGFFAGFLCVIVLCAVIAAGLLVWMTPSPRNADALVAAQAKAHGAPYPGATPPPKFVRALLATEDHRFFSFIDPGLDPVAVVRVAIDIAMGRRGDLGGSTIEQQLAKMLYTPGRKSFAAKVVQVAIGVKMRFMYAKPKILAMYADVVYFGDGYYGLERASCGYFGKQPAELDWTQATMLAGVVNGPSLFDPRVHPDNARRRQAHVFERLVAVGDMTQAQARAAMAQPLGLTDARCSPHRSGR